MPTDGAVTHRSGLRWSRKDLLVAFALYCKTPFGKIHARNPEIIELSNAIARTPSALCMKMLNFASLDSSVTSTGRVGLKRSSIADREIWLELTADWATSSVLAETALNHAANPNLEPSVDGPGLPPTESGTDRKSLQKVRVGQTFFRSAVMSAYDGRCCVSGLSVPELLVASHIVPWSVDADNRMNPSNGLLLSAIHDRAFDQGIMTIDDDLQVMVSRAVSPTDEFFASVIKVFDGKSLTTPAKFAPNKDFLAYHREQIFVR
ncbi:MAG: HNH endonuclease [Chloroflexi bacterium]|nr:HNH endonuclease [Chloroflexota bacterium]